MLTKLEHLVFTLKQFMNATVSEMRLNVVVERLALLLPVREVPGPNHWSLQANPGIVGLI